MQKANSATMAGFKFQNSLITSFTTRPCQISAFNFYFRQFKWFLRLTRKCSNLLYHPFNSAPCTKLKTCILKMSNLRKTQTFVKFKALLIGVYQHAINISISLFFQYCRKFPIERRRDSLPSWRIRCKNDRPFYIPLISIMRTKRGSIYIAQYLSIFIFCKKKRILSFILSSKSILFNVYHLIYITYCTYKKRICQYGAT